MEKLKTTLETSGEDVKLHSKRVHFYQERNELLLSALHLLGHQNQNKYIVPVSLT